MVAKQYAVEVKSDFLEKITRAKPVPALSELIWNAFDADAKLVDVSFEYNDLGTLSTIVVKDDGEGLPRADAETCFTSLGGSWKKSRSQTASGRLLHGQEGRGRFKAFALGHVAEWNIVYRRDGKFWTYTITMSAIDIRHVSISDEIEVKGAAKTGTTLTIAEPTRDFRTFTTEDGRQELTEVFALYLADYNDTKIVLEGTAIDPGSAIADRQYFNLTDLIIDNKHYWARLEVVEWKTNGNRALYLCNEQRFPLLQVDRRFHIPGQFQFSGYLASPYLDRAQKEGTVELAEMQQGILLAISEAQQTIKDHFRARAAEQARTVVDEWKDQAVYPFSGEPVTLVEKIERQVFDIVAVNVARHLPDFSASEPKNRKFQLRLLRQAIERGPEDLQVILDEVLNLKKKEREELAQLLRDTTLPAIIGAAKIVSDRLKFLTGLEAVLFDPEPKKRLKERSQLHRIVAQNCWLFGEEFNLSVDDRSLTEVLIAHKKILDPNVVIDAPVKHISQTRGIVDLMLSKATKRHVVKLTHLVVELKAPKVPVAASEITQIESYAFSVMNDPRFKQVDTTWVFWVISDELAPYAEHRVLDGAGLIHTKDNLSIYAKTWGQVIEENRARLKFFQDALEVQVDHDASLKYLQERYAAYLEGVFEGEEAAPENEGEAATEPDEEGTAQ
ncbi:ATP-binding protein [Burkholderia multivorans]|uniref:ATP-binding protein n=1 Tax=Burkholderia multivorans TaxID=87883 RepID=UPI001C214F03|nr:ATP-binding protein [Burkholderia multivorans]MBU9232300.1 ATP-binding protein [Burkholderia multivorans]